MGYAATNPGWHMRIFHVAALLVLFHAPALAEPDYMEAQRCIWRCQHNSVGERAYSACVARLCNDGPKASPRRSAAPAATPRETGGPGQWTFGEHPDLGRAAYVRIGEEAFGIACNDTTFYPGSHSISFRMTTGLAAIRSPDDYVTSVVDEPFALMGSNLAHFNVRGFFEARSNWCESGFDRLRRSKSLLYLKNTGMSLTSEGGRTLMTITQDGGPVEIRSSADLQKVKEKLVIPLAGSTAAIGRLINACPALRRQTSDDCTGGH